MPTPGGRAAWPVTACALLALAGCGSTPRPAASSYTVRPGDTVYSIARRYALDYRALARRNGLGADYAIAPGQVLQLDGVGTSAATPPAAPEPEGRAVDVTPAPAWRWPAEGAAGAPVHQPSGGIGLEILGVAGAEVRAAAAGRVVYTGAGLRGYGQLVIIKHDECWLSAYGYNRELLVQEGERVLAGQAIARMGEGPGRRAALYFEIRRNGHPIDALAALPRR